MRIYRRKNQRQRPRASVLARMRQRGRQLLHLFVTEILPCDRAAEHHARIQRVRGDVTVFAARFYRPPIMEIQRTVSAPARRHRWPAVLLRAVDAIGTLVVSNPMIELRCWLVVPGAPRLAAIARHDRSLIAADCHPQRLVGIDPQFMVIVSAGRATERFKSFPCVTRFVSRSVRQIDDVRILRVHADFSEVPPALPAAPVIRNTLPILPAVVGAKEPALLGVDDQVNSPRVAGRKSDADPPETFRSQSLSPHFLPMITSAIGAVQPAARSIRRRVNTHRRPARLPPRGINYFCMTA